MNLMKGAIESANWVSTVSPTYAKEILDPWFAHKLDPICASVLEAFRHFERH